MKDNKEFLLTSNQLAKACGISRATVLRLEDRGLIEPVDHVTGNSSRLYDISSLYQTQALLLLQQMGFDNQTIKDFIDNDSNYNVLKFALNKKIKDAIYLLDVISNYTDGVNHLSIQDSTRSNFIAYAEEVKLTDD